MRNYLGFKNQNTNKCELYLYGDVGYDIKSDEIRSQIKSFGDIKELNIYVNSSGGDFFEGISIYNLLNRLNCKKNVYIDGLACSISSVISMVGDNIYMPKNTMIMIHNPYNYACGNAKELRDVAFRLDKIGENIKDIYLNKSNGLISLDDLTSLMNNETWLNSKEAKEIGLCTEILGELNINACISKNLLKNYSNTPLNLKNNLKLYNINDYRNEKIIRQKIIEEAKQSIIEIDNILRVLN